MLQNLWSQVVYLVWPNLCFLLSMTAYYCVPYTLKWDPSAHAMVRALGKGLTVLAAFAIAVLAPWLSQSDLANAFTAEMGFLVVLEGTSLALVEYVEKKHGEANPLAKWGWHGFWAALAIWVLAGFLGAYLWTEPLLPR